MLSTAIPVGSESRAWVAGPPSPANPRAPMPATVLIVPLASTRRIRWLFWSAM